MIGFNDGVKGEVKVNINELDDFIIVRSDGIFIYNFVVIIDDVLMGIIDVIRGDDYFFNIFK